MVLAFGEAIAALGMLLILLICAFVLLFLLYRRITRKRISPFGRLIGILASLPLVLFFVASVISGNIEYNPSGVTVERITGVYVKGKMKIVMNEDGTYYSENVSGLSSGTWSNDDWNLVFDGLSLATPRWVTRNGVPAILPYYEGVDGADGVLLMKQ